MNVGAAFQPRQMISRLESRSHKEFIKWNLDFPDKRISLIINSILKEVKNQMGDRPKKLLDQVRDRIRLNHCIFRS